ncbi:sulfatase-like hydrolase/transferase [Natronomonas sp.]|uniref:sulfatase-like hydrolase/transferase n=1 Tax=Natronomonas sp. TaxID=2184060 RepID=UPI003974A938
MTENLVLVTLDSLRADHCGPDEVGAELAPTMRRMADEGVEYERAVAPGPRTPSSMPAVFTGEHLSPVTGEAGDFWERRRSVIRKHMRRHETIPERLRERGYHTVGVTVNPWTQDTAFDSGFDEFVQINGETLGEYGPPTFRLTDLVLSDTAVGDRLYWFNKREWFIRWSDFYETILDAVSEAPEPYFLWVFLLDTHQPYIVPDTDREDSSALGMYYASFRELASDGAIPDWVDTRLRRAYRDSVRSVDRFLDRLMEDTAAEDPVFVVHADHGEAFGEHGTYGHEQRLYTENIHVPLIVHNVPVRERVSEPISIRRLPRLIDALTEPSSFDPAAQTADFAISAVDDGHLNSITTRDWKLIQTPAESETELYHLSRDPEEQRNLTSEHEPLEGRLEALVGRHRSHQTERVRIADAVNEGITQL